MILPRKLLITGMHGMGDNIHERAIIRQLIDRYDLWLHTSWVSIFHDFIPMGLKVVNKLTTLRTQTKNAARERRLFSETPIPYGIPTIKVWYPPAQVKICGSVLGAMMKTIPDCNIRTADFRLPIPRLWDQLALDFIEKLQPKRPIMIYRPLTERREWNGSRARNPDGKAYYELYNSIRDKYTVISIADLQPRHEWITSYSVGSDLELHAGELSFELMAAIFHRATLVFCTSGFAVILAQAVKTPVACVFGTYEMGYSFSPGAKFSPYLAIEPIIPKDSFSHGIYDKTIDIAAAKVRLIEFSDCAIAARSNSKIDRG